MRTTLSILVVAAWFCPLVAVSGQGSAAVESLPADLDRAAAILLEGRVVEAIAALEPITAANPDFSFTYEGRQWRTLHVAGLLGEAYWRAGRWGEAIPWLERYHRWAVGFYSRPGLIIDWLTPSLIEDCRVHLAAEGADLQPLVLTPRGVQDLQWSAGAATVAGLVACSQDLGATVVWAEASQSATATLGDRSITFTLGRETAVVSVQSPVYGEQSRTMVSPTTNNQEPTTQEVALRVAPYLNEEGRMVVPLRPLVEALGGTVRWEPEAQIVYVSLPVTEATSAEPLAEPEATSEEGAG